MAMLRVPLFVVLMACGGSAWGDSVSGQFALGETVLKPTEVAAFRIRDTFNPRQYKTYVMLTTKAVNRGAIANDTDPYTTAINDEAVMSADYVSLFVRADGETGMNAHVGGTQYIDSSGVIMGEKGSLLSTCSSNTAERVACTVKVAKPVKSMDGPNWSIDVSFDAAVLSRKPGKPIAKDGGDPGKVLLALVEAAQRDDLSNILPLLTPSEAEDYQRDYNTPEENLKNAKQMFEFTLPKQPKITGGEYADENTALIEVEGVPYEDSRVLYIVRLERHDGRWGYASSQRVGMLD